MAQDDSAQLIRALELKRSDAVAVLESEPFLAPRIKDRVSALSNLDAAAHSVDVIVLYDALNGVQHRADFYPKLRQLLRPGGRVVNIDLSGDLPEAQAVQEFAGAGFHIVKTVGLPGVRYLQCSNSSNAGPVLRKRSSGTKHLTFLFSIPLGTSKMITLGIALGSRPCPRLPRSWPPFLRPYKPKLMRNLASSASNPLSYWWDGAGLEIVRTTRSWIQYGTVAFAVICIVIGAVEALFGR